MSYLAQLSREAVKRLDRLDRATCARIERRLYELKASPYDPGISKLLKGPEGVRSSRVGDWRILYTINEKVKTIYVIAIRPRGEAYRDL